jgi:hypothetical protein
MHLGDCRREQVAAEVEALAPESLARLGFSDSGFVVVVNGGSRQDVRQLHFHVITAGYPLRAAPTTLTPEQWTDVADPFWDAHQIRPGSRPVLAGLEHALAVRAPLRLDRRGYSIVWAARSIESTGAAHLLAD